MKKFQASKKSIATMGGICFSLLALLVLLSPGTKLEFLSRGITTALGFVGFWIILPFLIALAIFLMIKRKFIKIKGSRIFVGIGIIIFSLLIILSLSRKDLNFNNASTLFKEINQNKEDAYLNTALGGGYIGFVLAGAINSALGPIGLNIICWVYFFIYQNF